MTPLKASVLVLASVFVVSCAKDPEVAKREFLRSGDTYAAQHKTQEAIIEYRNAVAADPRFGEARLKLADLYLETGEVQKAYAEYVRAADLMPRDVGAQLKTAKLLLIGGQFADAGSRADKALVADPQNIDALIVKGSALAGLRDLDGALSQLEQAIKIDPTNATSYSTLGLLQAAKGDAKLAESTLQLAAEKQPSSVEAHLVLANFYWTTNRRPEAEQVLRRAVALDARNLMTNRMLAAFYSGSGRLPEAEAPLKVIAEIIEGPAGRLALADYYGLSGRRPEAMKVLEELGKEPAGFAPARVRLAALRAAGGDKSGAYQLLEDVLAKEPKHVDALGSKAEFQLRDRRLDEALATIQRALESGSTNAKVHFLHGNILAARKQYDEAVPAYQEALRLNPLITPAAVALAQIKLGEGKADEAIQFAQSGIQGAPSDLDARLMLVRAQLAKGDAAAAEQSLAKIGSASADAPQVKTEMGRMYVLKGDNAKARAAFEQVLAKDPKALGALDGLSMLDLREQKGVQARARIEAALQRAPDSGELHLLAARVYYTTGDKAAAEKALKQAVTLDSNNLRAYEMLGRFYVSENRLPEATTEFERLAQKQPKAVGPVVASGVLLQLQNRTAEARTRYEKALEIDQRNGVAANNLAWMYAEQGAQLDVALQLAQNAKAALPDSHEVNDTLGWLYYKKDMATLAVRPLREAVEKDPKNAMYHLHLGLVYSKTGEPMKAKESLERALALNPTVPGADQARAFLSKVTDR